METKDIFKVNIDREGEVREIAYYLWLDEGCPDGRHLDHWYRAESIWREREAPLAEEHPVKTPRQKQTEAASAKTKRPKTKSRGARESSARDLGKR